MLIKEMRDLRALVNVLAEDVATAAEVFSRQNTAANRRAYVRAVFALIEGYTYRMKQYALAVHRRSGLGFTDDDIELLTEERQVVRGGNTVTEPRFLRAKDNLKFGLKVYALALDSPIQPDFSKPGWTALLEATEIRNHVTHPKQLDDLEVNPKEMKILDDAAAWFRETTLSLLEAAVNRGTDQQRL